MTDDTNPFIGTHEWHLAKAWESGRLIGRRRERILFALGAIIVMLIIGWSVQLAGN